MGFLGRLFGVAKSAPPSDQTIINAARSGDATAVRRLLALGADINAKETYGTTVLMWASLRGHLEVVKVLLEKGADINAKDSGGKNALMKASQYCHPKVVRALLEKGADVNADAKDGTTALDCAIPGGHAEAFGLAEVRALLLQAGAKKSEPRREASTAQPPLPSKPADDSAEDLTVTVRRCQKCGATFTHPPNDNCPLCGSDAELDGHTLPSNTEVGVDAQPTVLSFADTSGSEFEQVSDALSRFRNEAEAAARLQQVKILEAMGGKSLAPLLREAFAEHGDPNIQIINVFKIRLAVWCGCALHPPEFSQYYRTQYKEGRSPDLDAMRAINMKDGMSGQTLIHRLLTVRQATREFFAKYGTSWDHPAWLGFLNGLRATIRETQFSDAELRQILEAEAAKERQRREAGRTHLPSKTIPEASRSDTHDSRAPASTPSPVPTFADIGYRVSGAQEFPRPSTPAPVRDVSLGKLPPLCRDAAHKWDGCICSACGKKRAKGRTWVESERGWDGCTGHDWSRGYKWCVKCGESGYNVCVEAINRTRLKDPAEFVNLEDERSLRADPRRYFRIIDTFLKLGMDPRESYWTDGYVNTSGLYSGAGKGEGPDEDRPLIQAISYDNLEVMMMMEAYDVSVKSSCAGKSLLQLAEYYGSEKVKAYLYKGSRT